MAAPALGSGDQLGMRERRGSELPIMLMFVAVIVALVVVVFFAIGYLVGRLVLS